MRGVAGVFASLGVVVDDYVGAVGFEEGSVAAASAREFHAAAAAVLAAAERRERRRDLRNPCVCVFLAVAVELHVRLDRAGVCPKHAVAPHRAHQPAVHRRLLVGVHDG